MLLPILAIILITCKQPNKEEKLAAQTAHAPAEKPALPPIPRYLDKLDVIQKDPKHYKIIQDTLGIRVIEATFKPGEPSTFHAHPDMAVYFVQGGTMEIIDDEGMSETKEIKTGETAFSLGLEHTPQNIGKTALKMILFEVRRPRPGVAQTPDAVSDVTKIDPEHYNVLLDSVGIRVLEINTKPGESSPLHAHPDNALYVIDGATLELTQKDGSKNRQTLKSGESAINAGGEHTLKNVGKTPLKAIMVEVRRARS